MIPTASTTTAITSDEFRDVIGRFASGVTVITATEDGDWYGSTASAVSSLSLEPPMLLTCLNQQSATGAAISRAGAFAVNILAEDQDQLARRFARKDPDKFRGVSITPGRYGEPLLDGALAHLECRVTEEVLGGTHIIFVAEVERALGRVGTPLAYFRGQFGRLHLSQDEQAHSALRDEIIDRSIEIGQPLDLESVADRLGVPQRSVQQALMRLVDEGLVRQEPDGSFVVIPLTFEVIDDAFRARLTAQLGAATLTVGRLDRAQLAELRRRMEATIPVRPDGTLISPDEWFAANQAFHEHMLRAAGSEAMIAAYRRFALPGLMTRSLGPEDAVSEDIATDHIAIVEAYEAGDLEAAREAIRRDYARALDFHRDRLRRFGGLV